MRRSTLWLCMLAVVLWAGPSLLAQGQGKGGGKERVKENVPQAEKAQGALNAAAAEVQKNVGKGKAGKMEDGGPAAKKVGQVQDAVKGKGKGMEQQAQALQKQLQHAQSKHMERQARLTRIRELAVKKGDTEMVARVDKLIAKESEVYTRKQQHGQGQPRAKAAGEGGVTPTAAGTGAAPEQKGKAGKEAKEEAKEQKKAEDKQEK